ncbi:phosphoglucomutase/phosphomannomutase, alpha/beta/alpha domain I [Hirsutella rhossiliensis]|uniref:Phosphoacetylglucosamine mutase n=1 Tax=Hirsutella rhossiliensis TaxID=111463 RepID=A0A9P8MLF7_9HYPO|nr:phosphoglucomutase/phosphomannomutase, alpha/beta/alpha domain I [Hirsutella rhossiliensis]KAH0957497.1 phosphoglucomutase/phosphomannomutase, alpha/beta/alpha domain I [Hirsutella rhossiliensis]
MDDKILAASAKHPITPGHAYSYGTAGFRMRADLLPGVSFRVGLLASLRSRKLGGQAIGVMVTASHNPAADNGVKIVDPMGEMLEQEWEAYATHLVNCPSDQALLDTYKALAAQLKIDTGALARVVYGRDTRPSGHRLVAALADALDATNTDHTDYKILTTPQLHYLTRCVNTEGTPKSYGHASEAGYYQKFSDAFVRALRGRKIQGQLTVDCANGVGGPKLSELLKVIPKDVTGFDVKVVNDDVLRPEVLNLECGADHVKTKQRAPQGPKPVPSARCCSFDGDADRLIYYWVDPDTGFFMLDGDRISSLNASFIGDLVRSAGLEDDLRIGVVQTAYANGASTSYIEKHLQLPVVCTPTGVKHLHHAACQFDIGVYFEANGHGTVVFSQEAMRIFREKEPQSPAQKDALETLTAVGDLVNQTVGDAITDMLMVEVILAHKGWTLKDWAMTYTDLPNRLVRVEVGNKDLFKATDAERRLSHPPGVQDEIDQVVRKYTTARSFARASGTENACRVYAEAATRSEADELANKVAQLVKQFGS